MKTIILHLRAPHDNNGNPRRAYVVLDAEYGNTLGVFDEGYLGNRAIPARFREIELFTQQIEVPLSEYKTWIKTGKALQ